jgi:thiamine biosynthesis lipoprotein
METASRLRQIAPALVDCGGDLAISSCQNTGQRWPVSIGDPLALRSDLGILGLGKCGVATSGIDYHRWQKDGQWKHHIIDPRTGQSAETDLLSVTIVAPDAVQAEAAAKAVLILGSREGLAWLEDRPFLSGLLVLQSGQVISSSTLILDLWSENASQNYLFS